MHKDEIMKKDFLSSKNVCIVLAILFSFLVCFNELFIVPSSLFLIIGGIQMFELTKKKKKYFEDYLEFKLKKYEQELEDVKIENTKLRSEFESLRNRFNISTGFGRKNEN